MNPAETFGDIIIDYSYVETTSACITALSTFTKMHPDYRATDIQEVRCKGLNAPHDIKSGSCSCLLCDIFLDHASTVTTMQVILL